MNSMSSAVGFSSACSTQARAAHSPRPASGSTTERRRPARQEGRLHGRFSSTGCPVLGCRTRPRPVERVRGGRACSPELVAGARDPSQGPAINVKNFAVAKPAPEDKSEATTSTGRRGAGDRRRQGDRPPHRAAPRACRLVGRDLLPEERRPGGRGAGGDRVERRLLPGAGGRRLYPRGLRPAGQRGGALARPGRRAGARRRPLPPRRPPDRDAGGLARDVREQPRLAVLPGAPGRARDRSRSATAA